VLVLRLGAWWRVLGAAAALSVGSLLIERLPIWPEGTDVPITLHYAGLFVVGMVLARDMPKLQELYRTLSPRTKTFLWVLAILCYSHQAWIFPTAKLQQVPFYRDGLIAIGVSIFIIFALSSPQLSAWLERKPFVFLGKVSYSIYLFHAVILLSLVHSLYGKVPLSVLWIGTGVLTLIVAAVAYQVVEVPSIRLGRLVRLDGRLREAQPVAAPSKISVTP
jgi:peptidoglycan/LPS O-acetylase OafA/YrhL